jgi:periplasmic divalent cation tolerance protein
MSEALQVFVTIGSREDAERIARSMVEARLAACVQVVGPMTSVYRWQGVIETAEEFLCLLKTRRDLYPELEEAIRKIHPYQVPEILALPVTAGNPAYLQWLDAETRPAE